MATTVAPRKTDWDARVYPIVINGVTVEHPSVTTHLNVIAKPLTNWAAKSEKTMTLDRLKSFVMGTNGKLTAGLLLAELNDIERAPLAYRGISDKAKDIGTSAHAWIEWHLHEQLGLGLGDEPILLPGADRAVEGFLAWCKQVDFEPICSETTVYNTPERYAGTYDGKARVAGKVKRLDFKVSSGIYNEYALQLHAYEWADRLTTDPTDSGIIVWLSKTEGTRLFEIREVPWRQETFNAYLAARDLWEWQRKAEGKSIGGPWA